MIEQIVSLNDVVPLEGIDEDNDILVLYKKSLTNTLHGIRILINWIKDETESEEKLVDSTNQLFEASQQIAELVNMLTSK